MLDQFLRDWLRWALNPQRSSQFHPHYGLCTNLTFWCVEEDEAALQFELRDRFTASGLDPDYPFNLDGLEYGNAARAGTMHLNPRRLAWVKEQLDAN